MVWEPEIEQIEARRRMAREMGGPERIADQRARGKLTIRERIDVLIDAGSFRERGALAGSADYSEDGLTLTGFMANSFVAGLGAIDGRPVVVGGGDFTARARPNAGERGGRSKGSDAERMALDMKLPLVRLIDGFGADIRAIEA